SHGACCARASAPLSSVVDMFERPLSPQSTCVLRAVEPRPRAAPGPVARARSAILSQRGSGETTMVLLFMLLGALVGAWFTADVFDEGTGWTGALFGLLIGLVLAQLRALRARVARLEHALER